MTHDQTPSSLVGDGWREGASPEEPQPQPDPPPADASSADAACTNPTQANAVPAPAPEPDEESLRLAEALVFASAGPVSARALSQLLPDTADADAVIATLRARYAGRGVELVETAGGVQFRTSPELAPRLRKVIEVPRKLPRVAMETLAIVAYHQPCTRAEIEEIRGTSLSQQTLDALLEANLVAPKGRREVPGRPTLWGTTPQFLAQFGLRDIRDLPQRTDLLLEPPQPSGVSDAPPLTSELSTPSPEADHQPGENAQLRESEAPASEPNPDPNPDSAPLSRG
jgi:segregation and condensation protein B